MRYRYLLMVCSLLVLTTGPWLPATAQNTSLTIYKLSPTIDATGEIMTDSETVVAGGLYFLAQPSATEPIGLYRASLFATTNPLRLSEPTHNVLDYRISPDQQAIVYRATADLDGNERLYHVSVQGGTVTPLIYPEVATLTNVIAANYTFSFDSHYMVFIANTTLNGIIQESRLYSIKQDGTELRQLDHPATAERWFLDDLVASTTDYRVVYTEYADDNLLYLYTTFITGTQPLRLSEDSGYRTHYINFFIDDSAVYFDQVRMSMIHNYIRQPLNGTAAQILIDTASSTKLVEHTVIFNKDSNADSFSDVNLLDLDTATQTLISSTGQFVKPIWNMPTHGYIPDRTIMLFTSSPNLSNIPTTLHSHNLISETTTPLITNPNGDFHVMQIPDTDEIVYQFQSTQAVSEPYRIDLHGGAPQALITNPPAGAIYGRSFVDLAGTWVYIPIAVNGTRQLYRVASTGGTREQVNQDLVTGGNVVDAFATSQGPVFLADVEQDEVFELYLARPTFEQLYIPLIRR